MALELRYKLIPTNPNLASYWNKYGGFGGLTTKGVLQLYQFGEYMRTFYGNYLNLTYDKTRVYARSTSAE